MTKTWIRSSYSAVPTLYGIRPMSKQYGTVRMWTMNVLAKVRAYHEPTEVRNLINNCRANCIRQSLYTERCTTLLSCFMSVCLSVSLSHEHRIWQCNIQNDISLPKIILFTHGKLFCFFVNDYQTSINSNKPYINKYRIKENKRWVIIDTATCSFPLSIRCTTN